MPRFFQMLKKLFSKKKKETKEVTPPLSPALSQSIRNFIGARGLPSMPRAAQKAFELSVNPDADARDFVEVIEGDEALSARVLKIANSVYFERGRPSETIEQSVFVIGLSELRNLLNATTLNDLFPSKHPLREQYWANAIATAIAAKILAQRKLPEKAEMAFMGGLMHDIGKLLILQRASKECEQVNEIVKASGRTFNDVESELFVFNHCEVGQLLARQWNFSEELTSVIRCHHDPWTHIELLGNTTVTLPRVIKVADLIAHRLGLGHKANYEKFQENCETELRNGWKLLKISDGEKAEILALIQKTYEHDSELYLQ